MVRSCCLPPRVIALTLAAVLGLSGVGKADIITDPAGDYNVPFYTGSQTGAFDVIRAGGTFDGTTFRLFATLAAPVSSAPVGSTPLYVWGIQTGPRPTPGPFADVGHPNVLFNRVFTLNAAGVASGGATGSINGADILLEVPASLLASTGFAPQDFRWNLWPRDASVQPMSNAQISDFAPNNATAGFTLTVPEPATLVVFAGLVGVSGLVVRRRSRA
jgi:hypothetical protein